MYCVVHGRLPVKKIIPDSDTGLQIVFASSFVEDYLKFPDIHVADQFARALDYLAPDFYFVVESCKSSGSPDDK